MFALRVFLRILFLRAFARSTRFFLDTVWRLCILFFSLFSCATWLGNLIAGSLVMVTEVLSF
jgi:hypothetical protein